MGPDSPEAAHERPSGPMKQFFLVCALAACSLVLGAQTLPLEPLHESGTSVTGAFEGWFKNADGSFSLLLGYFNRNTKQ